MKRRMRRESHVRCCESLEVRFLRATRQIFDGLLAGLRAECRDFLSGYLVKVRNARVYIGLSAVSHVLTQEESLLSIRHGWSKVITVQIARGCSGSKSPPRATSNLSGRSFFSCEGFKKILPVLEEQDCGGVVQTAEEFCSFAASFSGVFPEGFPAFADGVEGEGEQVHDGKGLGKVFLSVSKIMGEVVAAIFKHVEGFVLDLPACPSAGGDLLDVVDSSFDPWCQHPIKTQSGCWCVNKVGDDAYAGF